MYVLRSNIMPLSAVLDNFVYYKNIFKKLINKCRIQLEIEKYNYTETNTSKYLFIFQTRKKMFL